jgi:hypothetical protein
MTGSHMMGLHHILAETFGNFWITNIHSAGSVKEGPHHWPARSPDLNLNHLKSIIYRLPINSEADLRVRIQEAFVSVTEEMITNATTRSLLRRAQLCIQMNVDISNICFNIITYLNK